MSYQTVVQACNGSIVLVHKADVGHYLKYELNFVSSVKQKIIDRAFMRLGLIPNPKQLDLFTKEKTK